MTATTKKIPSTGELLLLLDQRRARTTQPEMGMSEVGGCRRRAGYRWAQVPPDNPGGSVQAAMGSAVHRDVVAALKLAAELGLAPGALVEMAVEFAGLLGHLDRYQDGVIADTKTTSRRWLDHIMLNGPDRDHLWQVHLYGCALVRLGHPVTHVQIDYLARDTGDEWVWGPAPFQPRKHAADALLWLRQVRETPLDDLPRDYLPDSGFCGGCPWRDTCWPYGTDNDGVSRVLLTRDPGAVTAAEELWQARQAKKAAAEREKWALAAVQGVRPTGGRGGVVQAGERLLLFTDRGVRFTSAGAVQRRKRKELDG